MPEGTFFGADIEALCDLALAMARLADHLERVDLRTADGLTGLRWTGADADACRRAWDETHAVTLHVTAALLREAGSAVLAEAEDQLTASEARGAGTPPAGTPAHAAGAVVPPAGTTGRADDAGSPWSDLRTFLATTAEHTYETLEPYTDGLGTVTGTVTALQLAGLRTRAFQALDVLPGAGVLEAVGDFSIGARTAGVLDGLGHLGTAMDAYSAYQGYRDGDLWQATEGTVAVGLAGLAAAAPNPGTIGAGLAWSWGSAAGEQINEAMEGTDFERRFTERMEPAFDTFGAWGMLNTPGALIVTAAESAGEAAAQTWTDATELWDRLSDGTTESGGGGR